MRHLIGIISYKMTKSLFYTVELLHSKQDIVLLVDYKTDLAEYESIKDKVLFLENRIEINWGTYSLVEATLNLMQYSLKNDYDYFSLISESDLPLKNSQAMLNFLSEHNGKEFIGFVPEVSINTLENIKFNYYPFLQGRKNYLRKLYKFLRINRLFKNPCFEILPQLYKGSNWFTLSKYALRAIFSYLEKNPEYIKAFRYSFLSDEIFFHTILRNIFPEQSFYALSAKDEFTSSIRYISWGGDSDPRTLLAEDVLLYKRENPEAFFIRKISDDSDFLKYLQIIREGDYEHVD